MISVVILTSVERGYASLCLERLLDEPSVEVRMVVLSRGASRTKRGAKLRKLLKIGLLGALNGIRMRKWFSQEVNHALGCKSIVDVARERGVPLEVVEATNSDRTVDIFRQSNADLGLSLGNAYISKRVFSVPKHGMVNVHHEELPRYRGAQSIIWQIHDGSRQTGYSIHEVTSKIDEGRILLQELFAIEFKPTLRETVVHNYAESKRRSVEGLARLLKDFDGYVAKAKPQSVGTHYTTPSFWQFLRMLRQHRKLKAVAE